jgi:hypothetical protein
MSKLRLVEPVTKAIDPEVELLAAMQAIALDAYGPGGAPADFAADLYRVVFCDADPVIGDTLITPPMIDRLRTLADQASSWFRRGTCLPEVVPLCQARMAYEYGIDVSPAVLRAKLLAMAETLDGKQRELLVVAEAMLGRLTAGAESRTAGMELGRDW